MQRTIDKSTPKARDEEGGTRRKRTNDPYYNDSTAPEQNIYGLHVVDDSLRSFTEPELQN